MFMKDFKVIDSAESAEKLRFRLKQEELEHYGSPITPEYVYDVIKRLPRFSSMRVCFLKRLFAKPLLTILSVATNKMLRSSLGSFSQACMTSVLP